MSFTGVEVTGLRLHHQEVSRQAVSGSLGHRAMVLTGVLHCQLPPHLCSVIQLHRLSPRVFT